MSLLRDNALFLHEQDKELKIRTVVADLLYTITENDEKEVLHVEFQRSRDPDMGKRLWEYNVATTLQSQCPVDSYVLYLRKDSNIVEPPYELRSSSGKLLHTFHFTNIKLWEMPGDTLQRPGLEGMLPLLPLTKDGNQPSKVEEMIAGLQAAKKKDLLPLGYAFAALVFESKTDRVWLKRRFDMLEEILEESWAYQEMIQKGLTKGLEKGLQQGLEQGLVQGREQGLEQGLEQGRKEILQRTLIKFVETRFSDLAPLARQQFTRIEDPEKLEAVTDRLFEAQTVSDARRILMEMEAD